MGECKGVVMEVSVCGDGGYLVGRFPSSYVIISVYAVYNSLKVGEHLFLEFPLEISHPFICCVVAPFLLLTGFLTYWDHRLQSIMLSPQISLAVGNNVLELT